MKHKLYTTAIFLLVLSLFCTETHGQQTTDTTGAGQISRELSINRDRAIALKIALQTNKAEIDSVTSNAVFSVIERRAKLKQLMAERDAQVNAILNPQERQRLKTAINTDLAEQRRRYNEELRQLKQGDESRKPVKTNASGKKP